MTQIFQDFIARTRGARPAEYRETGFASGSLPAVLHLRR